MSGQRVTGETWLNEAKGGVCLDSESPGDVVE